MSKKQKPLKSPSKEFTDAIRHAGSLVITCEFCGRTYFCTWGHGDYEKGELEELKKQAEEEPDKYIEVFDDDAASWGHIDGKQFVIGCPCNGARKYEDWILSHRYIIAEYFKYRAQRLKKELEQQVGLSEAIYELSESFNEFDKLLKAVKATRKDFPTKQGQRKVRLP